MADRSKYDRKYRSKPEVKARDRARKRAARARPVKPDPDYQRARKAVDRARRDERVVDRDVAAEVWDELMADVDDYLGEMAAECEAEHPDVDPDVLDWIGDYVAGIWDESGDDEVESAASSPAEDR